jgi:hypothetical protein
MSFEHGFHLSSNSGIQGIACSVHYHVILDKISVAINCIQITLLPLNALSHTKHIYLPSICFRATKHIFDMLDIAVAIP